MYSSDCLKGIFTALLTPIYENEELNADELSRQIDRQINAGVNGLFCLGTNGEFHAFSFYEKQYIMEYTLGKVNNRVPVIVNTGCMSLRETLRLSRAAEKAGADFVAVITPWFITCTQENLIDYYKEIIDSISLPLILYNIPGRTGHNLETETVYELSKHANIIGLKDSSGNKNQLSDVSKIFVDVNDFNLFVGTDSLILYGLQLGMNGSVSGLANVVPEWLVKIYQNYKSGSLDTAQYYQDLLIKLRSILFLGNSPSITKLATAQLYPLVGPSRKPGNVIGSEIIFKVRRTMEQIGIGPLVSFDLIY